MSLKMSLLDKPYKYDSGYIVLADLELDELPTTISVGGYKLHKKSEFHISLVCVKKLALIISKSKPERIQAEIVDLFEKFVASQPPAAYKLLPEFRFVERDERKTVVVMAEVPHLTEFFDNLRQKYQVKLPDQPTHITLYTLQPEAGIGLLSADELENDSKIVQLA